MNAAGCGCTGLQSHIQEMQHEDHAHALRLASATQQVTGQLEINSETVKKKTKEKSTKESKHCQYQA